MMNRLSYQIPLYTLYFLPVVMLVGLFFLPESPVSSYCPTPNYEIN
jgi:hypothetical protein